jgi:hypothetical protein
MCGIFFVLKKHSSNEELDKGLYDKVELNIFETAINLI